MGWADLAVFNASMGAMYDENRKPHGLFLEFGDAATIEQQEHLNDLGYMRSSLAPERWVRAGTQLSFTDLRKVFPEFNERVHYDKDLKPRWIANRTPIQIVMSAESIYPSPADLDADTTTGLAAYEMTPDEFAGLAVERMAILSQNNALEVDDRLRDEIRLALGENADEVRLDAQLAAMAHEAQRALVYSSACVIYQVGDRYFSPPIRFFREGAEQQDLCANYGEIRALALARGRIEPEPEPEIEAISDHEQGALDLAVDTADGGQRKPQDRIDDYGEKIGGAHKDRLGTKFSIDQLAGMSEKEIKNATSLGTIWPFSMHDAKDAGMEPEAAFWLYEFRRYLMPFSKATRYVGFYNMDSLAKQAGAYIDSVGYYRDMFAGVKTLSDIAKAVRQQWGREVAEGEIVVTQESLWKRYSYSPHIQRAKLLPRHRRLEFDYPPPDRDVEKDGHGEPSGAYYLKNLIDNEGLATTEKKWERVLARAPKRGQPRQQRASGPARPERPHLEHIEQYGIDTGRTGDISVEDFANTFGFRAVEFGEWLPQGERQEVLNMAYDGLISLAKVMGLPPVALGLPRESGDTLAAAFGSRGKGRALAHYECGRRVFNLTRMKGAGSLGHEYAHALDHWLVDALAPYATSFRLQSKYFLSDGIEHLIGQVADPDSLDNIRQRTRQGMERGVYPAGTDKALELVAAIGQFVKAMQKRTVPFEVQARLSENFMERDRRIAWARNWTGNNDTVRKSLYENMPSVSHYDYIEALLNDIIARRRASVETMFGMGSLCTVSFDSDEVCDEFFTCLRKHGFSEGKQSKVASMVRRNIAAYARYDANVMLLELSDAQRADVMKKPGSFHYAGLVGSREEESEFLRSANTLDKDRSEKCWGKTYEMFARAFESWAFDELQAKGARADYLVHGVEGSRHADPAAYVGNPYPAGDEREAINTSARVLMSALAEFIEFRQQPQHKAAPAVASL